MLKPYDEMRKIKVDKYCKERDGIKYLNWAKCIDLLHQNGAEKVYFEPLTDANGSSLFCSEHAFTDKGGTINRCYEIAIKVVVDENEWIFRGPVMNGPNPVKDNSMSQQRVWNAQTRAFVKCIAIHTGLGFDLWLDEECKETEDMDDLSKHSLKKIKQRFQELITAKMTAGNLTLGELADKAGYDEDTIRSYFSYFKLLDEAERRIARV